MAADALQTLIDRSAAGRGAHLRRHFGGADHALSGGQLRRYWGSAKQIALATATANGAPRVAPVDALLHDATLFVPTAGDAVRVSHVRARPDVGFTHWVSNYVAISGHGTARILIPADEEFATIDAAYSDTSWWPPYRSTGRMKGICLRGELAQAEPKRLRFALLHAAGLIVRSARRLILRIAEGWVWADDLVNAFARLPGWSLVNT
jgi:hypothetical protein